MKKYKHIKTGWIATEEGIENYRVIRKYENTQTTQHVLPKEIIENSSDWKEVIEKNYEILEYRYEGTMYNAIYVKEGNMYRYYHDITGQKEGSRNYKGSLYNIKDNAIITSIKRLSDGEVFSIGDNARLNCWSDNDTTLTGFRIKDDKLEFHITQSLCSSWYSQLEDFEKYKKPKVVLFTTEDNQPVYVNTKVCGVTSTLEHSPFTYRWEEGTFNKDVSFTTGMKYFSSKEAAQKYIDSKKEEKLLNSKCLSYNDLKGFLFSTYNFGYDEQLNKLKELVKSKQ